MTDPHRAAAVAALGRLAHSARTIHGAAHPTPARRSQDDDHPEVVGRDPDRWRRVHPSATRGVRRGVFTVNLAAMIDVIFLLLMYFLLSMDFSAPEASLAAAVPGQVAGMQADDPFALPVQPILVSVSTTEPVGAAAQSPTATGQSPRRGRSPGSFTIATDSPLLQSLPAAAADPADALRQRLVALRGDVLATDQPFVIDPDDETDWEHALAAFAAVTDAGFTRVRFTAGP